MAFDRTDCTFGWSSGNDSDSDDVVIYSLIKGASKRGPKVDRSSDDRTPWCRTDWDMHVAAKIRENLWNEYYHMPVSCFDRLHSLLFRETPQQSELSKVRALASTPMGSIDTKVKLASTLRQLFGEKQLSVVDVFKISKTSCRTAFFDVIRRINSCPELDGKLYATDHTQSTLEQRAFDFAQRSSHPHIFRHAVGAIDGLFIRTDMPHVREVGNVRQYYSGHKKGYGVNMQGVCDAQCRFIGFACNTPGSTGDYVAFRHSNFYGQWPMLMQPFYYLGDCAYPLSPFCMTPFVGTQLPPSEDAFNFFHSQLRITIERTFGIFVNVFGIFQRQLSFSIANTCDVIEACVKLHNYRINQGCQHVTRRLTNGATFRTAFDRSNEEFDVLEDPRYCTDRPHLSDNVYAQHVAQTEIYSGMNPGDAALGMQRRKVVAELLAHVNAARPSANVRKE